MLLSVVLMFADNRFSYLSQVRYYAAYAATPINWMLAVPRSVSGSVAGFLQSHEELLAENARLRDELLMRQFELLQLEHLIAENKRLNELLNASSAIDGIPVQAQLIGESPDPYNKRVRINKGSDAGAYVGQPVLDAYGFFGQVVSVEPYSSWVLQVTDPQHSTPVQVNRTGDRAIVSGSQNTLHEMVLNNMPDTADIQVGDLLVTSGLGIGQRFPTGYPVGRISRIVRDPGQPFVTVTVTPAAHLDKSRNLILVF